MDVSLKSLLEVFIAIFWGFVAIGAASDLIPASLFFGLVFSVFATWTIYNAISIAIRHSKSRRELEEIKSYSKNLIEREKSLFEIHDKSVETPQAPKRIRRKKRIIRPTPRTNPHGFLAKDDRAIQTRFWEGFRFASVATFLIVSMLLTVLIVTQSKEISEKQWQAIFQLPALPIMVGIAMGIFFGLIRAFKINTGNHWVGRIVLALAIILVPLILGALFKIFNDFSQ